MYRVMPPKKSGKQNKKLTIQQERVKADREATQKAIQDKNDHTLLDNEIAEREKVAAAERQEFENKIALTRQIQENFLPRFQKMPKVELHAHLSGSISRKTIEFLMNSDLKRAKQILSKYHLNEPKDMDRVFDTFGIIHEILEKPEALRVFSSNLKSFFLAVKEAQLEHPQIKVFLVISFDRSLVYEEANELLHLIGKFQLETNVIVGVELGGNPKLSGIHLLSIFQLARRFHGLGVTLHLAELESQTDDVLDYLMMLPDRVGHGTFLHTNPKFVEMMSFYKIPLEICLSSNVYSKTVPSIHDSHFKYWKTKGVPLSICTDDKGVIPGATLTEEYYKAAVAFSLTTADLIQINIDALRSSFAYKYNVTDLRDTWRKIHHNTLE
ncbi:hypothetical protein CAEBREN_30048 [Caenorhabditis brenneri]|uniref:Adenosine deaminase domain-containing protein n=1 Tax=Caenorhabditis brenneri TaxID=135651 RepID=G0PJF6_CAEBE|nr:hypothetical protein CAEBREN_30048 [Caenorhabditis brenneri]